MGKIILTPESLEELQKIIEINLHALQLANFSESQVRAQISKIIVSRFKKYLGIVG
jgi:hypothetical protein|tara:strand:+ start:1149 stop:1316 length:168 start_codon:yes stop_codon:yes gene_type:complete